VPSRELGLGFRAFGAGGRGVGEPAGAGLKRMQYRPALLDGFLASTGLNFSPCNPHP
jgi:hypothetical protein